MKEYFINKLTFRETERLIKDVSLYEYEDDVLVLIGTQDRDYLVRIANGNYQLSAMSPDPNDKDKWKRGNIFKYENGYFHWGKQLPLNSTMHKTFVSYYHKDDQEYRNRFENIFRDLIVSKSVEKGDIDSDNSDEYIKQLIQKEYLSDATVLVVLIGPKTKCRKHVDWEISGALNYKVGDKYAGLLGIILPTHPDFGKSKLTSSNYPQRLNDNLETGYAIIKDWTEDRVKLQQYIEEAFSLRTSNADKRTNSRKQMKNDTCE